MEADPPDCEAEAVQQGQEEVEEEIQRSPWLDSIIVVNFDPDLGQSDQCYLSLVPSCSVTLTSHLQHFMTHFQ